MHSADIAAALKRIGYTQAAVGTECGVGRGVANAVIRGVGRSRKVEERISELTGIPLRELWPQWYGEVASGVSVVGDGNQVAGRDQVGATQATGRLTIPEERLLRLFRALEAHQQDEVEQFIRRKIAGA